MFKTWIKQFIAMCICVIIILSSIMPAFAEDYVQSDSGDDATYYIIEGKDVNSLFDFGISDVPNVLNWIFQFKSYTVIKEYQDEGQTTYKMYFNTPNLQSILKNKVTSMINDGYTDDTYKVEDTEWVVKVGKNADKENVITKYGFEIPSYTYFGEYPKEVMSVAGILPSPKKWYEVAWRAIKTLFGCSFIEAPTADNFNTITYLNHTYSDKNDYILDFFCKYYLDYFERKIPTHYIYADDDDKEGAYFEDADDVIDKAVTQDVYDSASSYNNAHQSEYDEACQRASLWEAYTSSGNDANAILSQNVSIGPRSYDAAHLLASTDAYRNVFNSWVSNNSQAAYIMALALQDAPARRRYGHSGSMMTGPSSYKMSESGQSVSGYDEDISLGADLQTYVEDYLQANVTYSKDTTSNNKTYERIKKYKKENGSWVVTDNGSDRLIDNTSDTVTTQEEKQMPMSNTSVFRDLSGYTEGPNTVGGLTRGNYEEVETTYSPAGSNDSNATTKTVKYHMIETSTTEKKYNFNIDTLFALSDPDKTFSYNPTYKNYLSVCDFNSVTYEKEDIYPAELESVKTNYEHNVDLINKYNAFNAMLARGDDQDSATSKKEILYRQCMITKDADAEDGECWSKKYGDEKTSLTMINVYAYSRIYEVTRDIPDSRHELTATEAHAIISKLQSYCGPYYTEVIGNMMKLMCATAKYDGNLEPTYIVISDDKRVMPYDTTSLLAKDKANYDVTDPRVELYKTHIVGKLISSLQLKLAFGIYIKPQKTIINIAGKITELSVFMQQLCNFDALDGYGLSPTNLWTSAYVTLFIAMLALFFIIKTVAAIVKMGTNSGARVVIAFFLLVFELGLITAIAANPTKVWNQIKNIENKVINLGEMMGPYSNPDLKYLFGDDSDMEVTYYLPYLDTWSKYNTGYGILDEQQVMDSKKDYRELVDKEFPKIGSTEIKHWSVLLMDSFHYWGFSNSVSNTVTVTDKNGNVHTYNGNNINNNAYRVVDHFMAPRVELTKNNDKISMKITENENYNGQFQSGMVAIIVKLLNCILCCFISLIKFMTFLWQWFVLYIFIFKVILGRGAENKKMSTIMLETFSPTIAMVFIGMYASIIMSIGMSLPGNLLGIIIEIFLFWLSFLVIRWWHDLDRHQSVFPKTLNWIYMLTNISSFNRHRAEHKAKLQAEDDSIQAGMDEGWADKTLDEQREELFDENGQLKNKYQDNKYNKVVNNWYKRAQSYDTVQNIDISDDTRRAMHGLENHDKYKDSTQKIRNYYKNGGKGNLDDNYNVKNKNNSSKVDDMYSDYTPPNETSKENTSNIDAVSNTADRPKTGSGKESDNKNKSDKIN